MLVADKKAFDEALSKGHLLINRNNWWLFKAVNGEKVMARSMDYPLKWQPAVIGEVDFPMSIVSEVAA